MVEQPPNPSSERIEDASNLEPETNQERTTKLLPKPEGWGRFARTGYNVFNETKQVLPGDPNANKEIYFWFKKWVSLYLIRIEPSMRAEFLADLLEKVWDLNTQGEDWKKSEYVSNFREFFKRKYGFSFWDCSKFLSFLFNFGTTPRINFNIQKFLDIGVMADVADGKDAEKGTQLFLEEVDRRGLGEDLRFVLMNYGFRMMERVDKYSLAVALPESIGVYQWSFAKQAALDILEGRFNPNELSDKEFANVVFYLHLYGYTRKAHPAAQIIVPFIARYVSDDHPEFVKKIAEQAEEYPNHDSERLKYLKKLYLDYLAFSLHVQQLHENGGVSYVVTPEDLQILRASRGAFEESYKTEMERKSNLAPDKRSFSERENHPEVQSQKEARRSLATAKTAQAVGAYSRNLRLVSELYSGSKSPLIVKDAPSALKYSQVISRVVHETEGTPSFDTLNKIYKRLSADNLIPENNEISPAEIVILICFQIIRYFTPNKSTHREFIELFQANILPVLNIVHDAPGVELEEIIEQVSNEDFISGNNWAQDFLQSAKSEKVGIVSHDSLEVEAILRRASEENKNWLGFISKFIEKVTDSSGRMTNAPGKSETYSWMKSGIITIAIFIAFRSGIEYRKNFDDGSLHEFINQLGDILKLKEVDSLYFIGDLVQIIIPIVTTLYFISLLKGYIRLELFTELLEKSSLYIEKSVNNLKDSRAAIIRKSLSILTNIIVVISMALTVGAYKDELKELSLDLMTDLFEFFGLAQEPEYLGGWNSSENLDVNNSAEGMKKGGPEFYTFGIENYSNVFWTGKICDWTYDTIVCSSLRNDAYRLGQTTNPDIRYSELTQTIRTPLANKAYNPEEISELIENNYVPRGALVRINLNDENNFYEIPSGFVPTEVLVHPEDINRVSAEWAEGKGVFATEDEKNPPEHSYYIVYEPLEFNQEGKIYDLGGKTPINKFPYYESAYILQSGPDDPDYEQVYQWWTSDNSRKMTPIDEELEELKKTHFPAFFAFVEGSKIRDNNSIAEFFIYSSYTSTSDEKVYTYLDDLALTDVAIKYFETNGKLIVYPTDIEGKYLVAYLLPYDAQMFINLVMMSRIDGKRDNPLYDGLYLSVGALNSNSYDFSKLTIDAPTDPSDTSQSQVLSEKSPPREFMPDIPVNPDLLPPKIKMTYLALKSAQENDEFINTPVAAKMFYEAMIADGFKYGFEDFDSPDGETPMDTFNRLMQRDEYDNLIHEYQICNQFSFDIFILLRSLGYPVKIISGYQQIDWTKFGGMPQTAHQLLSVYNYETGLWEIFESTLPGENGVEYDFSLEFINSAEDEEIPGYLLVLGALAAALVLKSGIEKAVELRKELTNKESKNTPDKQVGNNNLTEEIEDIFNDLDENEKLALYYAITACMGVTVGGDPRPTGEITTYSSTQLPSSEQDVEKGWQSHDLDIEMMTKYILDLANSKSTLFDTQAAKQEMLNLGKMIKEGGFRMIGKNSPRIRAFFERRFRQAMSYEKIVIDPSNQSMLNIRSLAAALGQNDQDTAQKISKALFKYHKLVAS